MKKITAHILALFFLFPVLLFAQGEPQSEGLVPCGGTGQEPCDFSHLSILLQSLIRYFILFVFAPLVTVAVMYMGFLFVIKDQAEARTRAKKILWNIVIGTFFVLGAWVIINLIVNTLVRPDVVEIPLGN